VDNFKHKKSLGQNFLREKSIAEHIAEVADICENDFVIEIGAGAGALTESIFRRKPRRLILIEKDSSLISFLSEKFPGAEVVHGDAMTFDFAGITEAGNSRAESGKAGEDEGGSGETSEGEKGSSEMDVDENGGEMKILGNLPYNIATPLIMSLLEKKLPAKLMLFMLQKEVAERFVAKPGISAYGAATMISDYYASKEIVFYLPPEAFNPSPKVDSACVLFEPRPRLPLSPKRESEFAMMVKKAFQNRRKKIKNTLGEVPGLDPERRIEEYGYEELIGVVTSGMCP
jgi:16S rRNA (adenine1518-N6/adenine1519-N6)-dimethyltransferase